VTPGREGARYSGNAGKRKDRERPAAQNCHVAGRAVTRRTVAIVGAGPAGLMAAEHIAPFAEVQVFDRMAAPARKFMMAGRGGLNLTHSEALVAFLARYRNAQLPLIRAIRAFPPEALRAWADGLGAETFVGSSGRVFPRAMKASPLLRAWLSRLAGLEVALHLRHDWQGWTEDGALRFATPEGEKLIRPDATVLALGGASWPRLGGDGGWTRFFAEDDIVPFRPSNMGFVVQWSAHLRERFAGQPLKRIAASFGGQTVRGEAVIAAWGIEGGAIYALSGPIRDAIEVQGPVEIALDLRPDLEESALPLGGGGRSLANTLRAAGLGPAASALVQEARRRGVDLPLPCLIKSLPLRLDAPAGLARAISSAGGMRWEALDRTFMLRSRPGTFVIGEMLDWEAPTGGYLLQACFSSGVAAASGLRQWLEQ
jgi:uncharacterized flavoprotein (TIGR03862 family)